MCKYIDTCDYAYISEFKTCPLFEENEENFGNFINKLENKPILNYMVNGKIDV